MKEEEEEEVDGRRMGDGRSLAESTHSCDLQRTMFPTGLTPKYSYV